MPLSSADYAKLNSVDYPVHLHLVRFRSGNFDIINLDVRNLMYRGGRNATKIENATSSTYSHYSFSTNHELHLEEIKAALC